LTSVESSGHVSFPKLPYWAIETWALKTKEMRRNAVKIFFIANVLPN
jgi:hypothetical protein